jgi:flagellar hook-length control protein FliK
LALVTNVQQTTTSTTPTISTTPTGKSVGAIDATPTSSAASAAAITSATAAASGSDKTTAASTAGTASTFEAALKDAKLPATTTQAQQVETDDDAAEQPSETQTQPVLQNAAAPATPLILPAAAAEKSIQASIAQIDDAAIKVQQTAAQTPQPSAMVATQQMAASEQLQSNDNNNNLTPPVGSPAWDQALGQKVVWMAGGSQQSASLTLNPPDLGPMQVVLSVNNSHATVTFSSAQPEVRQALENAMPKLREMLGDAGIQLGQASINSGSAQQQNNASQQGSGNSSRQASDNTVDAITATASSVVRATPLSAGLGLVDTFA